MRHRLSRAPPLQTLCDNPVRQSHCNALGVTEPRTLGACGGATGHETPNSQTRVDGEFRYLSSNASNRQFAYQTAPASLPILIKWSKKGSQQLAPMIEVEQVGGKIVAAAKSSTWSHSSLFAARTKRNSIVDLSPSHMRSDRSANMHAVVDLSAEAALERPRVLLVSSAAFLPTPSRRGSSRAIRHMASASQRTTCESVDCRRRNIEFWVGCSARPPSRRITPRSWTLFANLR